jgi:hypothetical protein
MKEQNHLDGLEQELHDHIEAETGDNLARGMSPDRARQAARIKLGNISSIREEAYSVWHGPDFVVVHSVSRQPAQD